jgi:hypothetical protein
MNIHTSETEFLKTEVQRLRALVRAQQITIDKLEAQPQPPPVPPPWWPAVENILNEYGLQAIDFVADFKGALALAQPQQEPVAWLKVVETPGGWGKFVEAKPNEKGAKPVYTSPPAQRTWVSLTDKEIDQGLLRTNHAFKTAEAWRDGVEWAMTQLREKNAP